jgi:phage tail protein X
LDGVELALDVFAVTVAGVVEAVTEAAVGLADVPVIGGVTVGVVTVATVATDGQR